MKLSAKTRICIVVGLFSLISTSIQAADLKAGGEKAVQCSGCHGDKGLSSNGQFPRLAGQQANYLHAQLKAFKEGSRVNSIMQGIVAGLNDADMDNLAAFFSSVSTKPSAATTTKVNPAAKEKFAMCAGCHGETGEGRGMIPRLAGQHSQYLLAQLKAYKSGIRKGGPMPSIVGNLSDEDMKMLVNYLSSLK
jgi:cytochrome c553